VGWGARAASETGSGRGPRRRTRRSAPLLPIAPPSRGRRMPASAKGPRSGRGAGAARRAARRRPPRRAAPAHRGRRAPSSRRAHATSFLLSPAAVSVSARAKTARRGAGGGAPRRDATREPASGRATGAGRSAVSMGEGGGRHGLWLWRAVGWSAGSGAWPVLGRRARGRPQAPAPGARPALRRHRAGPRRPARAGDRRVRRVLPMGDPPAADRRRYRCDRVGGGVPASARGTDRALPP